VEEVPSPVFGAIIFRPGAAWPPLHQASESVGGSGRCWHYLAQPFDAMPIAMLQVGVIDIGRDDHAARATSPSPVIRVGSSALSHEGHLFSVTRPDGRMHLATPFGVTTDASHSRRCALIDFEKGAFGPGAGWEARAQLPASGRHRGRSACGLQFRTLPCDGIPDQVEGCDLSRGGKRLFLWEVCSGPGTL